jgi:hypothetical protein
MRYLVTAIVTRSRPKEIEPAGVTQVSVTREVNAQSWSAAVDQATETLLDDLRPVFGGLSGVRLMSVDAEVLA